MQGHRDIRTQEPGRQHTSTGSYVPNIPISLRPSLAQPVVKGADLFVADLGRRVGGHRAATAVADAGLELLDDHTGAGQRGWGGVGALGVRAVALRATFGREEIAGSVRLVTAFGSVSIV